MTGLDDTLLEFVGPDARVFWGGELPPLPHFRCAPEIFDADKDFRLPASWHGTFDAVYLTEQDLGHVKQWPLILDEALRLIDGEGLLFLRFTQGPFASVFQLMNHLFAWSGASVELVSEKNWKDQPHLFQLILRVRRTRQVEPVRSVSFAIITDGRKPASVTRFVESVLRLDRLSSVRAEILVCGPEGSLDHLQLGREETRLVPQPDEFTTLGWITRKKNLLVQAATGDVVVIAHDRYELAADFLSALLDFGPDFGVLVCRQETFDGRRFPDWVSIGSQWSFARVGMMAYGDWEPGAYVNGGVTVARRDVLVEHPWNELLFWNQAEDVELSRRLTNGGFVPRLARRVLVRTELSREDQMSAFEVLPYRPEAYTAPGQLSRYVIGTPYRACGRGALAAAQDTGVSLTAGWRATDGPLRWDDEADPELALTLVPWDRPSPDYELRLRLGRSYPGVVVGVRANGKLLEGRPSPDPFLLRFTWPADLLPSDHTARVELLRAGPEPVELEELALDVAGPRYPAAVPIQLGSEESGATHFYGTGWGHGESWGRWTTEPDARLRLPVDVVGQDVDVAVTLMTLIPASAGEQRVVVKAHGQPLDVWVFRRSLHFEQREVRIPARLVQDGWVDVGFQVTSMTSPAAAGENPGDHRRLGVGVSCLSFRGLAVRA